ncbi:hypothetical protein MMC13_002242 [Lambiella insularis]|nr:hypothetical protein [Lambiella insularis]
MSIWLEIVAACCLAWCVFTIFVCAIGSSQLYRHYSKGTPRPVSPGLPLEDVPHVTVIRPVKGLEPCLYECLAATFTQTYPKSKLTIYFCTASRNDPAHPILERVLSDYAGFDAKILVEEEDPNLSGKNGEKHNLGPNPKIRNMSRAYREAKGDIMWIIDCNVWVSKSVAGLMVDRLCGLDPASSGKKYKFVHQLPLAVDLTDATASSKEMKALGIDSNPATNRQLFLRRIVSRSGGLLDEMFLSTSHAKFYTAISTVAVAPCTVGKSNMFRRSHLDALTPSSDRLRRSAGIDYFSENICEDHLIGDLLWKTPVPHSVRWSSIQEGKSTDIRTMVEDTVWGNHALIVTPPCIQPVAQQSISTYIARRARWLRVRKFTVPLATLVEPGTESLLCCLYGASGLTTLPWCNTALGIPPSWTAFWTIWLTGVIAWSVVDFWIWNLLQSWVGEPDEKGIPAFVGSGSRRPFSSWLGAWVGREVLAWWIWVWAVLGGTTVVWRGRMFWVGTDMRVHEVDDRAGTASVTINRLLSGKGMKVSIDRKSR